MPLKGFICPEEYGDEIRRKDFITCFKCRRPCLPLVMRIALIKAARTRGLYISPTSINGCMRKTYMERLFDYYQDPTGLIFAAFRGTLTHLVMEHAITEELKTKDLELKTVVDALSSDFVMEEEVSRNIEYQDGLIVPVSGRFDLYHKPSRSLQDYKTLATKGFKRLSAHGSKEEYTLQTNFYRWLMSDKYPVDRILIHYFSMDGVYTSGRKYKLKDHVVTKLELDVIPILDEDVLLSIVKPKVRHLFECFRDKTEPEGNGGQWCFMCGNCQFKEGCGWYSANKRK